VIEFGGKMLKHETPKEQNVHEILIMSFIVDVPLDPKPYGATGYSSIHFVVFHLLHCLVASLLTTTFQGPKFDSAFLFLPC
jgi:hypothetical protein